MEFQGLHRTRVRGRGLVALTGVVVALTLGMAAPAFAVTPLDLGTLPGSNSGSAAAISDSGQVVGKSGGHAFSWTQKGGMIDLGTLGGNYSDAGAVSDSGQVVGGSTTSGPDSQGHAFSWTPKTGMVDLGTLGGNSSAAAVNDSGEVVGSSTTLDGSFHAFSWTQKTGMVDLGTLGGRYSSATALNDAGQVVGWADTSINPESIEEGAHAFSWTPKGGMVDLGTLGGSGIGSHALAINSSGQVVGASGTGGVHSHAFLWTAASGMVDLGTLGGCGGNEGCNSRAVAINASGQVVGSTSSYFEECACQAFSWTQKGGMIALGALGGSESNARAVNDSGQVVGSAETSVVNPHPFHGYSPPDFSHAFSWTQKGGMVDLGSLGGEASFSFAVALNDSGQVVGDSFNAEELTRPVLWNTRGRTAHRRR